MKNQIRFSQASLDFIVKASRQKKKEWLDRNREEYEAVLVAPMRNLMEFVTQELKSEAPGYRFPTRQFARIRRGADQSQGPFRDWIGVSISRDSGSRYDSLPNLYFHISEDDFFSAGGLFMPSADQTKHIRKWIDQDSSLFEELLEDAEFKKIFKKGFGTERVLKTKPRSYPLDHPRIEWLKLSGWYVWRPFSKKVLFSKNFPEVLVEDWRQVLRLNRILDRYTQGWPKANPIETLESIRPPLMEWEDD